MTQLTLEIPNDLASRLQPVRNRLVEIIELGLREITPTENDLRNEVVEFLASGPSQQEIIAFRPSEQVVEQVRALLYKDSLTPQEQAELDQYEQLDYLMTLIKARARLQQVQTA